MDEGMIVELFDSKDISAKTYKQNRLSKMHTMLIDQFLYRQLEMDEDSIEWLIGLIKVSTGDLDGFKHICKEYNISNSKSSIYKAICTRDDTLMEPLFRAFNELVPYEISKKMASIINGNIGELKDLILKLLHIKEQHELFGIDYRNSLKMAMKSELKEKEEEISIYLMSMFNLIEGESFSLKDLKNIIKRSGIDAGLASILYGFNALLNNDFMAVGEVFAYKKFKNALKDKHLVDAIIRLISGRWNDQTLKLVVGKVIQQIVSDVKDPEILTETITSNLEFRTIRNIIEATEGNMLS